MSVTTAKVVACKACGSVFGVEPFYNVSPVVCPATPDSQHQVVFVLVVVPLA